MITTTLTMVIHMWSSRLEHEGLELFEVFIIVLLMTLV
jgi:hypothetical protein